MRNLLEHQIFHHQVREWRNATRASSSSSLQQSTCRGECCLHRWHLEKNTNFSKQNRGHTLKQKSMWHLEYFWQSVHKTTLCHISTKPYTNQCPINPQIMMLFEGQCISEEHFLFSQRKENSESDFSCREITKQLTSAPKETVSFVSPWILMFVTLCFTASWEHPTQGAVGRRWLPYKKDAAAHLYARRWRIQVNACLHIFLRSSSILSFIYSLAFFSIYWYITSSQCCQLPVGLIAQ